MALALVACLAGFFAGAFAVTVAVCISLKNDLATVHIERKRWINKALIRDGQSRVFPNTEIEPDPDEKPHPTSFAMRSPFANKRIKLKETIADGKKAEAGQYLPDIVKDRITAAAEARRSA